MQSTNKRVKSITRKCTYIMLLSINLILHDLINTAINANLSIVAYTFETANSSAEKDQTFQDG